MRLLKTHNTTKQTFIRTKIPAQFLNGLTQDLNKHSWFTDKKQNPGRDFSLNLTIWGFEINLQKESYLTEHKNVLHQDGMY